MAEAIVVGRIRSPYGVKGWVWMDSFTDDPASVFEWTPWTLSRQADAVSGRVAIEGIEVVPSEWAARQKGWVVRFDDRTDRTAVEPLVNCLISVDADHLPALDADTFYWRDLTGCRVVTSAGTDLGAVSAVMATGANDVLVVQGDAESMDGRERLIPFIDAVALEVDVHSRRIEVDWDPEF
jgi:16S rRNA processing protein RimM